MRLQKRYALSLFETLVQSVLSFVRTRLRSLARIRARKMIFFGGLCRRESNGFRSFYQEIVRINKRMERFDWVPCKMPGICRSISVFRRVGMIQARPVTELQPQTRSGAAQVFSHQEADFLCFPASLNISGITDNRKTTGSKTMNLIPNGKSSDSTALYATEKDFRSRIQKSRCCCQRPTQAARRTARRTRARNRPPPRRGHN